MKHDDFENIRDAVDAWYNIFSKKTFENNPNGEPFANVECCTLTELHVYQLTQLFKKLQEYFWD